MWGAIAQWSEHLQLKQEALGSIPSGCPGFFLFQLAYTNVKICGVLVQFGCYQHRYGEGSDGENDSGGGSSEGNEDTEENVHDTEATIRMLDSSFEGDLTGDDIGSDDGLMADHDQAGLDEIDDDGGSTTVMSSSEHGEGSDGENDSGGGSSEGNEDTEENVDENEGDEESCGSENELEQEATTPKTRKRVRKPQAWKRIKRSRLRNSGKSYISAAGKKEC